MEKHSKTLSTAAVGRARPAPRRRWWIRALLWGSLLGIMACVAFGLVIDIYGQTDRAEAAQAIVILGAEVRKDGEAGDSLRARTLHAAELYHRNFAPKIICTGGRGLYPPTEAEVASALAIEHGVSPADLLQEYYSTNTTENARYAARICRAQHWTRVLVVSDPYHLWRARRDFAREGLIVSTSPAKDCLRNRNIRLRILWTAREVAAVVRDVLCGL